MIDRPEITLLLIIRKALRILFCRFDHVSDYDECFLKKWVPQSLWIKSYWGHSKVIFGHFLQKSCLGEKCQTPFTHLLGVASTSLITIIIILIIHYTPIKILYNVNWSLNSVVSALNTFDLELQAFGKISGIYLK